MSNFYVWLIFGLENATSTFISPSASKCIKASMWRGLIRQKWSDYDRAVTACDVTFEEVRIPKAYMVGQVGEGFKIAMEQLDQARIGVAAHAVGKLVYRIYFVQSAS